MAVVRVVAAGQGLAGKQNLVVLERASDALCAAGWMCMSHTANRISLNKGYTESGFAERVFHLHLRLPDDTDELFFCDYLCKHTDVAKEYESLKLSLWKKFEFKQL